jgi:hypothetical protein
MRETRSTTTIRPHRDESSGSDLPRLTPSPPKMSDPALAEPSRGFEDLEDIDRFTALEHDLAKQKASLFDIASAVDDIKTSIATLALASRTPPDTKRGATAHPIPRPSTPAPIRGLIKPGTPQDFDGDRAKGRAFLNSCRLYISLSSSEFADDQGKIHWVLSYMKSGRASTFADRVLRHEDKTQKNRFATWAAFQTTFAAAFCSENDATHALMRLEGSRYFQGRRTVDEYVDEFEELIDQAGYTDDLAIVMKFRRGLDEAIQNKIAETGFGRPSDDQPEAWYAAARRLDLNRLANEAFRGPYVRRPVQQAPANPTPTRGGFIRLPNPTSQPPPQAVRPTPRPTFTGTTPTSTPRPPMTCFRCGITGHGARDCPQQFDVRSMTMDELSEAIENRYAKMDVATEVVAVADDGGETERAQEEDFAPRNE